MVGEAVLRGALLGERNGAVGARCAGRRGVRERAGVRLLVAERPRVRVEGERLRAGGERRRTRECDLELDLEREGERRLRCAPVGSGLRPGTAAAI